MADSKESPSAFEKSLNDAVQKALANTEPLQVESKSYEKVPATALKSRLRDRKSHRTMMKLEKKQRRVRGKEEFREDHKPPQFIFEDGGIGSLGTSSVGNDSGNNPLPQIHIPDSGSVRSANSRKAYGLTRQMQDAVSVGSRGKKKEQAPLPPGLQFGAPSISNASELPKDLDAYVQRVSGRGAFVGDEENPNGSLLRKQSPYQTSSYPGEDFYTWNRHNVNQTRKRNAYIAGGTLIAVLILAVTLGVTISDTEGGSVSAEASRSESDIVSGRTVPLYPSLPTPPDFVGKSLPRTNDIWTKESLQGMLEAFAHSNHLEDSSTPQGKSFSWLLEKDDLKGLSSTRVQQRYALASIFYASQTQKWKNQYGWLTKSHECSWFGVKCGNDGYSFDNTSGDLTDVITYINLKDNNMEGSLPQEFNLFPKLAQLNLAENFFTGSVPSDLFLKFHKMRKDNQKEKRL